MRISFSLLLAVISCGVAQGQGAPPESRLQDRIVVAEEAAERSWEQAKALGAGNPGTMWNEVDAKEHRCTVLGLLLDKEEHTALIQPLVSKPLARTDDDYASMLQVHSISFSNFVHAAKYALNEPLDERIVGWNLDCVGHYGIPGTAAILGPQSRAKLKVDGETLFVIGDIEEGFAEELARVVASNPKIEWLALTSGGGGMVEAMRAGYMVRALGLNTTLYGNCFSACVLLFIGGVERQIWSPYPELGFHQASLAGRSVSPGSEAYDLVGAYVEKMGVNRRFVLASMFSARPEDMYFSDTEALCENRVATWIQRLC